jgi:hypothetical protein
MILPVEKSTVLFCAVIPAALACIGAIRSDLDFGILALYTYRLIMLHTRGLGFLIHEDWLLYIYLDIPRHKKQE